ncbi:MAG: 2-amino-4-hydroxy-6-hydroxymethyldihydropteridine diphosphokinase [Planctomycetota bacterium]|nr:2-amino-4-hydroxy-6-hydroxymethyldihydropteridine diphosphokinase [Planctomycetota bacterium]
MGEASLVRRAFLGLGSNLGERSRTLEGALELLRETVGVRELRRSTWHETAPVGGPEGQGDYLNGVCELWTTLTPEALLTRCQEIELLFGRERLERHGPRTLDIDLLWYEGEQRMSDALKLPHPRLEERVFVLAPLAELAPELLLAESGETVAARARALDLLGASA